MSDANFLGTLSITGRVGTAEMSKLVQDYKELEKLRKVAEAARNNACRHYYLQKTCDLCDALKEWKGENES